MCSLLFLFFFFNDTATTEIYTLSLHDALPISPIRLSRCLRIHAHSVSLLVLVLELDLTVDHREQRVVRGAAHVEAGVELRPPLLHEDAAGGRELPGEPLHAPVLRTRIAPDCGG